jgi:hypothetical protein
MPSFDYGDLVKVSPDHDSIFAGKRGTVREPQDDGKILVEFTDGRSSVFSKYDLENLTRTNDNTAGVRAVAVIVGDTIMDINTGIQGRILSFAHDIATPNGFYAARWNNGIVNEFSGANGLIELPKNIIACVTRTAAMRRKANDAIQETRQMNGVTFYIEWPAGSTRIYQNSGFKKLMLCDYGFIPFTVGADGEELDIFINPDAVESPIVFEIEQTHDDGSFDESKHLIGFDSEDEAKDMFLAHQPENHFGSIKPMSWKDFTDIIQENKKD